MTRRRESNQEIAEVLENVARLLEQKGANRFRIGSYRKAADTVRHADHSIAARCREAGPTDLERLPGVGGKLARSIGEIVETGRLRLADRLEAEVAPEELLARVPGVGKKFARRLHGELGIDSVEELERAAHDGRLDRLPGIGEKRLAGIRDSLAGMLSRSARRRARRRQQEDGKGGRGKPPARDRPRPAVQTLLDVDAEYRRKAKRGELKRIAPRRFNPEGEAWLPILHTERDGWSFTALFSNTARAHERNKTHDWVVLYYERDGSEDQCTVVTADRGPLTGKRVIRGRERECRAHYGADAG
jgi:hypothetical protein